ncbi:MAG: hypothetical protein PHR35_01485 [Kiritimatiellae bacterium]|nr:hypothetical protein [Kiritimatiellia bacterium]
MIKTLGILLCTGVIGAAQMNWAASAEYPCYQLQQAPVLDGKIESAVWGTTPEVDGTFVPNSKDDFAERPAWFRAGWTPDALWVAVRCQGSATNVASGVPLWLQDSVEVSIVPVGGRLQLLAGASGERWEAKRPYGDSSWNSRVVRDAEGWTAEFKIPFRDCGPTAADGTVWPFTTGRYLPGPSTNAIAHRLIGEVERIAFHAQALTPEKADAVARGLAAAPPSLPAAYAAAMQAGVNRYAVQPLSDAEKAHPYTNASPGSDYCGARKYFSVAYTLASNDAERARALLQVGHCLYAISARVPSDKNVSLPHRELTRCAYEQVTELRNADPGTLADACLYVTYSLYNVGEFKDIPAIQAAARKTLSMPDLAVYAKMEALRMLSDCAIMLRDYTLTLECSEQALNTPGADVHSRGWAQVRFNALDHWRKMSETPRAKYTREYPHDPLDPAASNVLPAIAWARPGLATPLRALIMCYRDGRREVSQWAQRLDMEPTVLTTPDRRTFGEKSAESYAAGAVGFAVAAAAKQEKLFVDAMDKPADVMVLAEVAWTALPQTVREKMLKKVADGTPLILKTDLADRPDPSDGLASVLTNRVLTGLTCVYPFKGLPAFARFNDRQAWQDGVLERYRHGKGEVWVLKGFETPDYQLLTPGTPDMPGASKLVEYDYYLALVTHLLRQAAKVPISVRIEGSDFRTMNREAPEAMAFQLVSATATNVTAVWTVRDRDNRIVLHKQEQLSPQVGTNNVACGLGAICGGEYFLDLQVKDGERVLDFGSAFVTVQSADRIADVTIPKSIGKGDAIKGKVRLALSGKTKDLTVHVQRRDNYRRVVGTMEQKARKRCAFKLPTVDPVSAIQFVDVELRRGSEVLDRRSVSFRLKDFEEADRHAVVLKESGKGSYLAEYLSAGHERAGCGRVLNNVVTEALCVKDFGKGTFAFDNPRLGWIFIAAEVALTDTNAAAWVRLGTDDDSTAVLEWNGAKELRRETMRRLEPGTYRVFAGVRGAASFRSLIVRMVPENCLSYPSHPIMPAVRARIDWNYLKQHVLSSVNVVDYVTLSRGGIGMAAPTQVIEEWKKNGGNWFAYDSVPNWTPDAEILSIEEVVKFWTAEDMRMAYVDGIMADECTIAFLPKQQNKFDNYAQACLRIGIDPAFKGKVVYPWIGLGDAANFRGMMRQLAGSGHKLLLERYAAECANGAVKRDLALCYDLEMAPFWEVTPEPQKNFMQAPCPGMMAGTFNCDVRPDVNYKVFLDMQYNYLVNAPAMAGLYGFNIYAFYGADEETMRWLGKLYRHYFIEGRRNLLSKDPYVLTHLVNPDFADGLKGWTVTTAGSNSVATVTIPNFGRLTQNRSYLGNLSGADEVVSMRRSVKGPNRLTQTIRDLQPGRLYSVSFYTYDSGKAAPGSLHAVSLGIERGETLPSLSAQTPHIDLNRHFTVFRAKAATALLTISDWKDSAAPGGQIGQDLLVDCVQVQPYMADEPEPPEVSGQSDTR